MQLITITDLPHLNASLNGITILLLAAALFYVRNGNTHRHKQCMLASLCVSAIFLISYLIYHFNSGLAKFGGVGVIRPIYFSLLIAHVLIAIVITFLVPVTAYLALSGRFERHKRIARWTWPLWMFVAVSGVVVYFMAIHWFPLAAGAHG
jgi:putative membrane protein